MTPQDFKKDDYPPGTTWRQAQDTSPPILTCNTPDRRSVVLSQQQWTGHILSGHPEMQDLLAYVEWSLQRPDHITRDRNNPDRQCYYVRYTSRRGLRLWIRSVVHFDSSVTERYGVDGFVVTSHITGRVNSKEASLWP